MSKKKFSIFLSLLFFMGVIILLIFKYQFQKADDNKKSQNSPVESSITNIKESHQKASKTKLKQQKISPSKTLKNKKTFQSLAHQKAPLSLPETEKKIQNLIQNQLNNSEIEVTVKSLKEYNQDHPHALFPHLNVVKLLVLYNNVSLNLLVEKETARVLKSYNATKHEIKPRNDMPIEGHEFKLTPLK